MWSEDGAQNQKQTKYQQKKRRLDCPTLSSVSPHIALLIELLMSGKGSVAVGSCYDQLLHLLRMRS